MHTIILCILSTIVIVKYTFQTIILYTTMYKIIVYNNN